MQKRDQGVASAGELAMRRIEEKRGTGVEADPHRTAIVRGRQERVVKDGSRPRGITKFLRRDQGDDG
ncbi:hypothetical protein MASR2M8_26220 [Opitutaceae bacterium]